MKNESDLVLMLRDLADKHEYRMSHDVCYRHIYYTLKAATERKTERSNHYDRNGYCDNPSRGY